MARLSGSALPGGGTCLVRKPSWWVSITRMANKNTITPICPAILRSRLSPARSRRARSVNKRISHSRTGVGSLRRTIVDRTSPPCLDVDDGIGLPAVLMARSDGAEKRAGSASPTHLAGSASDHAGQPVSFTAGAMPSPRRQPHQRLRRNSIKVVPRLPFKFQDTLLVRIKSPLRCSRKYTASNVLTDNV